MAKDPRFNFYPDNWMGGTKRMSLEQKGAYIELLMLNFYALSDGLPGFTETEAASTLAHAAAYAELFAVLKQKFVFENGFYCSARLLREFSKSKKNSENQQERANKRWNKDKPHMPGHMPNNGIVIGIGNSIELEGGSGETPDEEINSLKLPANHRTQVGKNFSDLYPTEYLEKHHPRFYRESIMGKGLKDHEVKAFDTTDRALYKEFTNSKHLTDAFSKFIRETVAAKLNNNGNNQRNFGKGATTAIQSGNIKDFGSTKL
jgi:uncharacterized protein YdaU (DUF1376 family)